MSDWKRDSQLALGWVVDAAVGVYALCTWEPVLVERGRDVAMSR